MAMEYHHLSMLRNGNGYPPSTNYSMQHQQHQQHQQQQQQQQHYGAHTHTHQGYSSYPYTNEQLYLMAQMHHQRGMMGQATSAPSKQAEPKPRLSKDEVELLEREFQKNPKPSSGRKREIAELLKVEHPRINNWFQNRRAKEKQMKKTREFEAQQALERAASGSDSESPEEQEDGAVAEYFGEDDHSQACQVSSAAFPSEVAPTQQQPVDIFIPEPTDSGLSSTTSDISPSEEDAQSLVQDEYPSPKSLPFQGVESGDMGFAPLANSFLPAQSHNDFESQVTSPDGSVHDPMHPGQLGDFDAPHSVSTLGGFEFTTSMAGDNIIAPVPSFPSQLLANQARCHEEFMKHEEAEGCALSIDEVTSASIKASPHSPPDLRFKSPPPPANLATRRNKGVPAQLNPTALRSYSYGPKTGIDMGRRPEAPSPMRRIASATGTMPGRIHKPSMGAAPRSPLYLERTKEALIRSLQAQGTTRSPVLGSINTALSPVTPSDCLPSGHQGMREATVSSSASDDEQRYTFGAASQQGAAAASSFLRLDSTLKTPPGTPGLGRTFQEQMITIDPAWNYVQQDEPLITPGLGSFGSEEFSMAPAAPGYVVQSQPPTPSFAPGIGPTYFPWGLNGAPTANAEYTFPNEPYMATDVSAKSSPTQPKSKQFQFTQNITPQDFSVEK